jgi:hypothetical protein
MNQAEPLQSCKRCLPLEDLLGKAADTVPEIGPEFIHYGRKLADLSHRFSEGRFHLAVLGQFKRGKSTLLNALTGDPILPMGVVPLTAAPTFIQFGEIPKIRIRYRDSRPEDEFTGASAAERSAYLADFVTEKGNPQNRLGIAKVQVELPAPILSGGVVLQALQLPQQLEEKIAVFEKSLHQAASERRLIQDVLEGDKKRVGAFVEDQARDLRQEAEQL